MMKITEVARLLGKPEKTIRYWIRHEKLPARLVNGQYEIDASDLPVIPEESPGIDSLITRIEGLERKLDFERFLPTFGTQITHFRTLFVHVSQVA